MNLRVNVAIIFLAIYSVYIGISYSLHIVMFLPLLAECARNFAHLKEILKKLFFLNLFIFVVFITLYFSDAHLAFIVFIRSNMVMFLTLCMFYDRNYFDIAYGLDRLKMPDIITSMFYFSGKFIYLLLSDIKKFNARLKVRGFRQKTSLHTYKIYANFIGLFFINALRHANVLKNVLFLRGFRGKIYSFSKNESVSAYEIILGICIILPIIFQKGYFL